MEEFFGEWRRRFAVHAALILALSVGVGFAYFGRLSTDDWPLPEDGTPRWCQPWDGSLANSPDHPCKIDSVAEQRWSSAHEQALLHALLLLGFAAAAPYFRIGRFAFSLVGWALIFGCWAAPISSALEAWTLYSQDALWAGVPYGIGIAAGVATTFALGCVALRSLWEALRDGIAPPTWRNWALIVKARPRRIVEPADIPAVEAAVQRAIDERMPVRAFGGRYSWNAIATSRGAMIDMRGLHDIGEPTAPDPADTQLSPRTTKLVKAGAGALLRELTEELAKRGLMLETSTVNPWVQLGGALALGCHGTGIHHKPLTDLVTALEIVQYVDVNGQKQALTNSFRRPLDPPNAANANDWRNWNALIVNLGCLGVMVRVELECTAVYNARILDTRAPMRCTIESEAELRKIVVDHEFSEIFWFPFNRECFVRTWDSIPDPNVPGFSRWFFVRQWLVANVGGPVVFFVLALLPFLTPPLSRLFHYFFGTLDHRVPAHDAMQYERFFPRVYDTGYAIPIAVNAPGGFAAFQRAWLEAVDRVEAARHEATYPQNLVLHARFGAQSAAFLAPNGGPGESAFIELITHANTSRFEEHFSAVERSWRRLGGRAHWGKVSFEPGRILDSYAPAAVQAFRQVRDAFDPDEIFLNDYVRTLLRM
jgi:FAD/FMN-containing dehydrogenase